MSDFREFKIIHNSAACRISENWQRFKKYTINRIQDIKPKQLKYK